MFTTMIRSKQSNLRWRLVYLTLAAFVATTIMPPRMSFAERLPFMPKPGVMVSLSPAFTPAHLTGLVVHPEDALKFDFLIDRGDKPLQGSEREDEYKNLVKYFLASLTVPEKDQWVNLSPYEKNRIIEDDFGKTEMGRDLLAQDYLLKQITSSLIYPEDGLGKKFWERVYDRAQKEFGTTNIPMNTFNKVWIIPDEAAVYESGNTVYVLRNHLKVMLEEDYLSLEKHSGIQGTGSNSLKGAKDPKLSFPNASVGNPDTNKSHALASRIVKEIILPELEKEVNEGQNFAKLRQIYSGMILATWYKHALKESLLGKVYANKAKVKGVRWDEMSSPNASVGDLDKESPEFVYQQYLQAFKKGVFNYIKEDVDRYTKETIPRKYFSGGTKSFAMAVNVEGNGPGASFARGVLFVFGPKSGGFPASVRNSAAPRGGRTDRAVTDIRTTQGKRMGKASEEDSDSDMLWDRAMTGTEPVQQDAAMTTAIGQDVLDAWLAAHAPDAQPTQARLYKDAEGKVIFTDKSEGLTPFELSFEQFNQMRTRTDKPAVKKVLYFSGFSQELDYVNIDDIKLIKSVKC